MCMCMHMHMHVHIHMDIYMSHVCPPFSLCKFHRIHTSRRASTHRTDAHLSMADAQKPTPEQEESRLNLRTSALDWFMNPVPQSRCSPSLETSDDKRLEEMKAMLRSRPVSTESRFIKASDAPKPVALNQKKWAEFPLEQRIDINHNTRRCPHPHLHPHPHPNPHPNPLQPQPQPQPPPGCASGCPSRTSGCQWACTSFSRAASAASL